MRKLLAWVKRVAPRVWSPGVKDRLVWAVGVLIVGGLVGGAAWLWRSASGGQESRAFQLDAYLTSSAFEPPRLRSDELSLLGIGYGARLDEVARLLPSEQRRTDPDFDKDGNTRDWWRWKRFVVSVEYELATRSVLSAQVQLVSDKPGGPHGPFLSLPYDLLLGRATVRDLVRAAGRQPDRGFAVTETDGADPYYLLEFEEGAEGSSPLVFQITASDPSSVPQPSEKIDASVCDQLIIGVELNGEAHGGASWPSSALCTD